MEEQRNNNRRKTTEQHHSRTTEQHSNRSSSNRRKRKQKSAVAGCLSYFFIALIICVVVGVSTFFISLAFFENKTNNNADDSEAATSTNASNKIFNTNSKKSSKEINGVISKISNNEISIIDIKTDNLLTLAISKDTNLFDKYGNEINKKDFSSGDIVEFEYSGKNLKTLRKSTTAWEYFNIDDAEIDSTEKNIVINGKDFSYSNKTFITYDGEVLNEEILPNATVITFRGIDDFIWNIDIISSVSHLKLNNKDHIKDGMIKIDDEKPISFDELTNFEISDGQHTVVISGSNIEQFSQTIVSEKGKGCSIDLSQVQVKTSFLTVKANVDGYKLFIDGTENKNEQPIVIEYGKHEIKLTKEGYDDFVKNIQVNSDSTDVYAEMSKTKIMGSLQITSNPEGAEVYIDGAACGATPYNTKFEEGTNHSIIVKKAGYHDSEEQFVTISKDGNSCAFTLTKEETIVNEEPVGENTQEEIPPAEKNIATE